MVLGRALRHPVLAAGLVLGVIGCATLMDPGPDEVSVTSIPPGARIFLNEQPIGQTPMLVPLDRHRGGILRIDMPGYEPIVVSRSKKLNGWLIGDICLTGLVGIVIDVVTNNHERFDTTPVSVQLTPIGAGGMMGAPIVVPVVTMPPPAGAAQLPPPATSGGMVPIIEQPR